MTDDTQMLHRMKASNLYQRFGLKAKEPSYEKRNREEGWRWRTLDEGIE
jgi:hypothetical protein